MVHSKLINPKTRIIMLYTLLLRQRKVCLLLFCMLSSLIINAQTRITGKVTASDDQQPVIGASVKIQGSTTGSVTGPDGTFAINAKSGDVLVITYIGYQVQNITVGSATNYNVTITPASSSLNEVVVTGYSSQRKKDIIGAVAVVDMTDLKSTPGANIGAQLQGRASGVTVSSTGAPGSPAVVRIRGFQSAGNNNPLYVIDGVPTEDPSVLNPQDVESMQILKDGSAAAIYGTRAANGVVIVTTKQGKEGRSNVSYENYVGVQNVTKGMRPEMLDNSQYIEYLKRIGQASHNAFGAAANFTVPDFLIVSGALKTGVAAGDPRAAESLYNQNSYQILKTSPQGTDWFDAILRKGLIQSHQLSANGGSEKVLYSTGLNYFNQQGTIIETGYERYTVRANTTFKPKSWFRFGENLQVSSENRRGGDQRGEGAAWSSAYRMVPYIPVYDIKGGFGGNGIGDSGNGSNPVANLMRDKDDKDQNMRVFGNAFVELQPVKWLTARSSMGLNTGAGFTRDISRKTYERAENQGTTQLNEQAGRFVDWTLTNTLTLQKEFASNHNVTFLLGQEAIRRKGSNIRAFGQNFDFDDADFISLRTAGLRAGDRNIFQDFNNVITISSLFARGDYSFKGKYLVNATIRRDGANVFGPENRYGNFLSAGLGWRLSEEKFLKSVKWLNDLKLRAGFGSVGSLSIASQLNSTFTFTSGAGSTNYDIGGNNTSTTGGYRLNTVGNLASKWETTESKNLGFDMTILNSAWDIDFNVFQNDTKDLLVRRQRIGLDRIANQPLDNVGTMRNRGVELGLTNRGTIKGDLKYDLSVNFSRYKNELTKFNNEGTPFFQGLDRFSNAIKSDKGLPISTFFGYQIDGFYNNQADIAALPLQGATPVIGTWKYKDINGDKIINSSDVTTLGNPHPDFQLGTQLNLTYKNFDFNTFLFWNQGNEIYNYTKWYTDMRGFVGGVSDRVLNDSWTPQNMNAKLPIVQAGVASYNNYVSGQSNSYYVEDGSYLRVRTLQLGYTLPKSIASRLSMSSARLYIQGQNLFTFTKYTGADPDLALINNNGTDLYIGVDRAGFPNPQQFIFGLNVSF